MARRSRSSSLPSANPLTRPGAKSARPRTRALAALLVVLSAAAMVSMAEQRAGAEGAAPVDPGLRKQLLAKLAGHLFDRLGDAREIGRGSVFLHTEHLGVHQLSYGLLLDGPNPDYWGGRLIDPELGNEALGRPVYSMEEKRVDPEALQLFLAAAFVSPDEPLLGTTAKAVYPVYRRRLQNEYRLYRGVTEQLAPKLAELERTFQRSGKPAEGDRLPFYRFLYERSDELRSFGIMPCELRDLDLGFWVRRVEDGTAPLLGGFMRKVLAAYDGEWLAGPGARIEPFTSTRGYLDGSPVELEKKGGAWVIAGGEANAEAGLCTETFRADPPDSGVPAVLTDTGTGDRLVRRNALPSPWRDVATAVGHTADSKQLVFVGTQRISWVDAASLREVRSAPLSRGDGRPARLARGGDKIVRPTGNRTEVIDLATGALVEKLDDFLAGDSDASASVLAQIKKSGKEADLELEVRKAKAEKPLRIALRKDRFEQVKLMPSGSVAFVRQTSATSPDRLGWKAWDVATGERRKELDVPETYRFDLSPSGTQICWVDHEHGQVLVDRLDPKTGKRTSLPGKSWPGRDCLWISEKRLLLHSEREGVKSVLQVMDVDQGAPVGRAVRIPNWYLENSFRSLSPDGRWLVLSDLRGFDDKLLLWSLK